MMNPENEPSTDDQPDADTAAERRWSKHAGRLVLMILYSVAILSIGGNIRVWHDVFTLFGN